MTEHTPGPWHAGLKWFEISDEKGRVIAICPMATIFEAGEWSGVIQPLIAAAPSLLEACVEALEAIENDYQDRSTMSTLRAAIAKARGEA